MGYHGMFSTSYMYVLNELRVCSERATCILNELHVCPEPNCVLFCRFVLTFCAYFATTRFSCIKSSRKPLCVEFIQNSSAQSHIATCTKKKKSTNGSIINIGKPFLNHSKTTVVTSRLVNTLGRDELLLDLLNHQLENR